MMEEEVFAEEKCVHREQMLRLRFQSIFDGYSYSGLSAASMHALRERMVSETLLILGEHEREMMRHEAEEWGKEQWGPNE
jgi:hypothetical protein